MPAIGQPSNVPREPVYGEQQEIDAQIEAAPLPEEPEAAAIRPVEVPETDVQETEEGVPFNPRNLISVLPPERSSPSETFMQPMDPIQMTALAVGALPNLCPAGRALVAQVMGRFEGPGYVGEELPAGPVATEYDEIGLLPPEEAPNA